MPATAHDTDPGALLLRIARNRDPEALTQLYRCFSKRAFGVAYFLTQDKDLAEEALQEGFLRIWLSAGSFREEGTGTGWMLRIIAGKSLELLRRKGRHRDRLTRVSRESQTGDLLMTEPPDAPEGAEIHAALRQSLAKLPEIDRQVLTLYYTAGCTQDEMARLLATPQRTISHQLKQALQRLRQQMAEAGFALGAGNWTPEDLAEAATAPAPPAALQERVLESMRSAEALAVPPGAWRGSRALWVACGATGMATLALLAPFALERLAGADPHPPQGPSAVAPLDGGRRDGSAAPGLAAAGRNSRWSFEAGVPAELKPFFSTLRWTRGSDGKGQAIPVSLDLGSPLLLPGPIEARPHLLKVRLFTRDLSVQEAKKTTLNLAFDTLWSDGHVALPNKICKVPVPIRKGGSEVKVFVSDRYVLQQYNGVTRAIFEYERPYPARRLAIAIENWAVREIALEAPSEAAWQALSPKLEIEYARLREAPGYKEVVSPSQPLD